MFHPLDHLVRYDSTITRRSNHCNRRKIVPEGPKFLYRVHSLRFTSLKLVETSRHLLPQPQGRGIDVLSVTVYVCITNFKT